MAASASLLVTDDRDCCASLSDIIIPDQVLPNPVDFGHLIPLIEEVTRTP
jgi:hypothetical protein